MKLVLAALLLGQQNIVVVGTLYEGGSHCHVSINFSTLSNKKLKVKNILSKHLNTTYIQTFAAILKICAILSCQQNTHCTGVWYKYRGVGGEVALSWAIKLLSVPCNITHGNALPMMIMIIRS